MKSWESLSQLSFLPAHRRIFVDTVELVIVAKVLERRCRQTSSLISKYVGALATQTVPVTAGLPCSHSSIVKPITQVLYITAVEDKQLSYSTEHGTVTRAIRCPALQGHTLPNARRCQQRNYYTLPLTYNLNVTTILINDNTNSYSK